MKLNEEEFLAVILGADITAYSLARSFHEEYGIKSVVLSMRRAQIIAQSKIIDNRVYDRLDEESVLVERLLEVGKEFSPQKKLIALGCGDWYVRALIENKAVLEPYYIVPYIDETLLNNIVHKEQFYAICDELEIPHPKTYVYACGQENDLKLDFPFPVVAKPANSATYHYAEFPGKKKAFYVESEDELRDILSRVDGSGYDGAFLIQDFIPGDDSNMRVLTCYSDKNGKVRFSAFGRVILEDHTPGGIGNPVAIINETNERVVADATKFLEHVGYTGFSNFDIKYDTRDGSYNFFEINVRLGRSNFYVTGSGFNTVKWIVDELVYDKPLKDTVADRENLFTVVPKGIILRYASEPKLREQVKRLYRAGKVSYPLDYAPDMNLKRRFYVYASLMNQYRKYHKYP